jgi:putative transposase
VREWFSAAELADMQLPGMPATKRGLQIRAERDEWTRDAWRGTRWRDRQGRGGGVEFHLSVLTPEQHAAARMRLGVPPAEEASVARDMQAAGALWHGWARRKAGPKAEAQRRLQVIQDVEALVAGGASRMEALAAVLPRAGVRSAQTFYNWERAIEGLHRSDWLPALTPKGVEARPKAECSPEAWEYFQARYLLSNRPTLELCYRDLQKVGAAKGWTIPSLKTLARRIAKLDPVLVTLKREGRDAVERMYPAQQRTRTVFHAMEAVNADGHRFDVFCRWPNGKIDRPMVVAFQDLYSNMCLSWRASRSETSEMVRLAYGELGERYAIPTHAYFDNGMAFAAKENTGGSVARHRFKIKADDDRGVLVACGTQITFVTPAHGQAKPIERMFGDWARDIAKDVRLVGAWTGNNPMAKPADYASRAVPIELFMQVLSEGIAEYNNRRGRHTEACKGSLSFREAFEQSFATVNMPRLSPAQRAVWWLASEGITARAPDGAIWLYGNRFWAPFMNALIGRKLTVRFNPEAIQDGILVFDKSGDLLGDAPCISKVGFNDKQAAKDHSAARKKYMRSAAELEKATLRFSLEDLVGMKPPALPEEERSPSNIPRLVTRGNAALQARPMASEEEEQSEATQALMRGLARQQPALRVVRDDD